jgi:3-oxoacyl-[acyl-carrier protein] reductase
VQEFHMLFSVKNRKVLITGASGAIGGAIANVFAESCANITISGTKEGALLDLKESIRIRTGNSVNVIPCDLSNGSETEKLVSLAADTMDGIDILVNSAGINRDMLLGKMAEKDLDDVLKINLNATFLLSKNVIAVMSKQRHGRIINISSVVGFTGNIGQVNYCASKAAIVGMSRAIAMEVARKGITVNCVAPGAINSPMMEKLSEKNREKFIERIPVKRIGEPMDVAYVCRFLASDEASYITGQTIHVNGGMLVT